MHHAPLLLWTLPYQLIFLNSHNLVYTYELEQFTTVYFLYGYYMLFAGKKMIVMLNTKDMPEDIKAITGQFIKEHVDLNKCKLAY